MKKLGLALLEVIVAIMIIMILISVSFKSVSIYKNIINNLTVKSTVYEVSNLLSLAKHYSYSNSKVGKIYIDSNDSSISFVDTSNMKAPKLVKLLKLPKEYRFVADIELTVSNSGVISSNTIWIMDSIKEYHKISIVAGVDIINIYFSWEK